MSCLATTCYSGKGTPSHDVVFKNPKPQSNEKADTPKCKDITQNTCPVLLKSVKVIETKDSETATNQRRPKDT